MTVDSNSPDAGVGEEVGTQEIVQTEEQKVVPEKDYKNLEAFATRSRQSEIDLAKRLVEKDKSELMMIKDTKVRDTVVRDVFGYNSFEEMTAIEGEDFAKSTAGDEDELAALKKTVRKLSYTQSVKELDSAISSFKKENPELFRSEAAEDELRDKLKLISGEASPDERVRMAGKLAFSTTIDPTTAAYKAMAGASVSSGG